MEKRLTINRPFFLKIPLGKFGFFFLFGGIGGGLEKIFKYKVFFVPMFPNKWKTKKCKKEVEKKNQK